MAAHFHVGFLTIGFLETDSSLSFSKNLMQGG